MDQLPLFQTVSDGTSDSRNRPVLAATLLALGSAGVHATWNLIIKTSDVDRRIATWGVFLAGGLLTVPVIAVVGAPGWVALPWLVLSGAVHMFYAEGLAAAYTHGDLSATYPVARGGGALLAAVGGVALLGDHLPIPSWIALAIIGAGLMSIRGRGGTAGLGWAGFTAVCIATYTLVDSHGARESDSAIRYGLATIVAAASGVTTSSLVRGRAGALRAALPLEWRRWVVGGACTAVAYTLVLAAVRYAPVGYVTALRESSVVLGALAGWFVLHESMGRRRLASAGVILAGLVLLVVTA
jgi:drug/metabolite transporter (DMT)-like permease